MTKANLRRKTALLRVLESRLDKREDALHELHERSQEKVREVAGKATRGTRKRYGGAPGPILAASGRSRLELFPSLLRRAPPGKLEIIRLF